MAEPMRDGVPAGGPRPPPPLTLARPDHPTNFEYDDNEWDVGIGDLIIDLDADIEKTEEARSGMASVPRQERAPDAPRSALKMKIKRTKPGTKTSEAKHEIVKSNEANGSATTVLATGGEPVTVDRKGAKHLAVASTPNAPTHSALNSNSPSPLPSPASAAIAAVKRSVGAHRKDKSRDKHQPGSSDPPLNTPLGRDLNGVARLFVGPGLPSTSILPASTAATKTPTTLSLSTLTDLLPASLPPTVVMSASTSNPPSTVDDAQRSISPVPPPAKRQKNSDFKNDSDREAGVDACVGTSVGTITEPDCLGPCEPGTSVTLEGIVWHETEGGVLVVNVTWRGKTYVGTLLDCTRHDWAPPRFCDSPTEELDPRSTKGRGAKRGRAAPGDLSNFTETRTSMHCKLRNVSKGRRAAASPTPFTPPRAEIKRRDPTVPSAPSPQLKPKRAQPLPTSLPNPPPSPSLLECPKPNCSKKYKNLNGLSYHSSHAHGTPDDDEGKDATSCSENDEFNAETPSPATVMLSCSPKKMDVDTSTPPIPASLATVNENILPPDSSDESSPPDMMSPLPTASQTPFETIRPTLALVTPFGSQSPGTPLTSHPTSPRTKLLELELPPSPSSAIQPQVAMPADLPGLPELHSPAFKSKTLNSTEETHKTIEGSQSVSPLPKRSKMRKSPGSPSLSDRPFSGPVVPPDRDEVCSPAYSDISDDATPAEVEPNDTKEPEEEKSDMPSPRAILPGYGVYQFFGQPPFMAPTGQQPSLEQRKPKHETSAKLPESKLLGERELKQDGPSDESIPPQKILPQHFYPYGYVPPGYPYGSDVPFGSGLGPGPLEDENLKSQTPEHIRDHNKGSPRPTDVGSRPSQVVYGPHALHGLQPIHSPSLVHEPHLQHSPHTQHPSHAQHSPHAQYPSHPSHTQHPPHPPHPQHQHLQQSQHSQQSHHPPLKPKPPESPKDAKHSNENHQILKESIEMKSQMSPYMFQRQHHAQQHHRDEEMRRYYASLEQQRRKENVTSGECVKPTSAFPPPGPKLTAKLLNKEKPVTEQELLKPKEEPKPIKQEGQKPTMESTGPPPPPTSQYYLHPSYMQPSHYGTLPFDPVYRSLNPMLVPAPFAGPWGSVSLPRYHAPEDLSRPPPPSPTYFPGHKIHELQERALKSPPAKGTGGSGGGGTPSVQPIPVAPIPPSAIAPAPPPAPASESKESSRSPPPQRHVHTHHHTHVGLGYPIYPAPYPGPR